VTEPSPKKIYLARRNPALTPDGFRARWRRHGAIAMARASWVDSVLRYVQADPIPFTGGLAGASDGYDAVGTIVHRSVDSRRRCMAAADERRAIVADEDEIFAARIAECGLDTVERLVFGTPGGGLKIYRFLWRRPELDRTAFRARWSGAHAELAAGAHAGAPRPTGYVQNDPLDTGAPGAAGIDCDGVEETAYATLLDLVRAADAAGGRLEVDRAEFVGRSVAVIAVDTVLLEKPTDGVAAA
jgi:hypothetical protein